MKLIITLFTVLFITGLNAQNKPGSKRSNKQNSFYCLIVKGEEQVLVRNGKEITEDDVKLKNGDRISIEGRLRKVDGTEVKLKEGECVNENGDIVKPE